MKVEVEVKVTFLEGERRGQSNIQTYVADTQSKITEYGVIERLNFEWNYFRPCFKEREDKE